MKKIRMLVVLVGLMFASASQAQLIEGLLFGAISTGINSMLAGSQQQTISAVKMTFDVYYVDPSGGTQMINVWDSTTQTSVWFPDSVILKVKPFYNRGPARDLKFYINDRLFAWRDVEGGKWNYSKNRIEGAKGVVNDYPFVQISDLDMGMNQIKVRVSDKEWGSATLVRLDPNQFLQLARTESARMATAGAGHSLYPVLQSLTVLLPDGTLRNFASADQMELELGQIKPAGSSAPVRGAQGNDPGGFPTGTNRTERDVRPLELYAYEYSAEENRGETADAVKLDLAAKALQGGSITGDVLAIPVDRGGLAILLFFGEPINVQLKDEKGTLLKDFPVVRTDTPQGPIYSCLVGLGIGSSDKPTSKLVVTAAGKTIKTIKFEKKK